MSSSSGSEPAHPPPPVVSVRSLIGDAALGLELNLIAGEAGLDRPIRHSRIQKSGLALVGHFHGIVPSACRSSARPSSRSCTASAPTTGGARCTASSGSASAA